MSDEALPPGTYEEASEAWLKFEATDDPGSPRDELEAALLVAARRARADERERIRQIAIRFDAVYDPDGDGVPEPFADLIREPS